MRFPKNIKKVTVRSIGKDRIISPVESTWDSFFLSGQNVTDDFMTERSTQIQTEREISMIKFMLDTNIVIYVIKQKPLELLDKFNLHTGRMGILVNNSPL